MKPSEIIEKKYDSKIRIFTGDETHNLARQVEQYFDSILEYLDEEWEKNQIKDLKGDDGAIAYTENPLLIKYLK